MSTIVIGGTRRRRSRNRRRNPREGIVPKPGQGAMIAVLLLGIAAAILAAIILNFAPMMAATAPRTGVAMVRAGTEVDRSALLGRAARMVEACPSLRPMARSMISDRDLSPDEFASLVAASRRTGCPPPAR